MIHEIQASRFREDLFYRLNVIELALPALSERKDDVIPLVNHFVGTEFSLSKHTQQSLEAHHWPGNVRELENACKRAVILAQSHNLIADDFGLIDLDVTASLQTDVQTSSAQAISKFQPTPVEASYQDANSSIDEKANIQAALDNHKGVIARVAKSLGLSRQALYRRMEKYGIEK